MGLDHEDVGAPDALLRPDVDLPAGESEDLRVAQLHADVRADLLGQRRMRRAREQHHALLGDDLPDAGHAFPLFARRRICRSFRSRYPETIRCSPRSTARAPGGTSLVITEPAPVTAPLPIRTGATNIVSLPIRASSPI